MSTIWKPTRPRFRKYKRKVFDKIASTGSFIYHIGEAEFLRQPSKPVSIESIQTPEFKKKVAYLKRCMRRYRKLTGLGRGIAAVQIGIPERFAVIWLSKEDNNLLIIINPKITKESKKLLRYPEVCMSANPLVAPVVRPSWIEFEYFDEKGNKQFWNTKDTTKKGKILNRVFEHEIDHMNGVINIDRVESKSLIFEFGPAFHKRAKFEEIENR